MDKSKRKYDDAMEGLCACRVKSKRKYDDAMEGFCARRVKYLKGFQSLRAEGKVLLAEYIEDFVAMEKRTPDDFIQFVTTAKKLMLDEPSGCETYSMGVVAKSDDGEFEIDYDPSPMYAPYPRCVAEELDLGDDDDKCEAFYSYYSRKEFEL